MHFAVEIYTARSVQTPKGKERTKHLSRSLLASNPIAPPSPTHTRSLPHSLACLSYCPSHPKNTLKRIRRETGIAYILSRCAALSVRSLLLDSLSLSLAFGCGRRQRRQHNVNAAAAAATAVAVSLLSFEFHSLYLIDTFAEQSVRI